jgi:hypothetical protein
MEPMRIIVLPPADEKIATNVYKYKKMHEFGHREGLVDMFTNGTDCTQFPPIFWMITGANLHPSGKRLAIQTYSGAFEYVFSSPLNFEELATLKPRQLGLPRFDQVESIVYGHDGKSLFAIPEALGRKGWQKVEQILCKKKDKVDDEEEEEEDNTVADDRNSNSAIAIRSLVNEGGEGDDGDGIPASLTRKSNSLFGSFLEGALGEMESNPGDENTTTTAAAVEVDFIVLDSPGLDATQLKAHANAVEADKPSMVASFLDRVVPTTDPGESEGVEEEGEEGPQAQSIRSVSSVHQPGLIENERIMGSTLVLELTEGGE